MALLPSQILDRNRKLDALRSKHEHLLLRAGRADLDEAIKISDEIEAMRVKV